MVGVREEKGEEFECRGFGSGASACSGAGVGAGAGAGAKHAKITRSTPSPPFITC